mmetsp:Transcript_97689/g.187296  ORF Transcript_97689/g.187296 Transcript_97689/m.187296 type:complete len:112 (-) Transcript_97689:131-466(-)
MSIISLKRQPAQPAGGGGGEEEAEDKEEEEEADADASKKPAASKATRYDGTFSVPELADFVQPKDLRIEAKWKGSAPPADKLSTAVEWLEKLKDSLREQVSAFVKEYREQG